MSSSSSSSGANGKDSQARTAKKESGSVQKVLKFGLVGDGTVGKTTVLLTYTTQAFIKDYVPTVFDNFSVIEDVDNKRVNVILWDTAGQEDYVAVRRICYEQTAVYFLCFSLVHPNSFHNIKSKWLPELKQYAPNATVFLVGTKTDLLDDKATLKELKDLNEEPITQKQAVALQKEIGAHLYLTCSGKDVASVNKVFRDAIHFLLDRDKKQLEKEKKTWKKELKEVQQIEKELAKLRIQQQKEYAEKAAHSNNSNSNHSSSSTGSKVAASPAHASTATPASADDDDDDDNESADTAGPPTARPATKAPVDDDDDDDDGNKKSDDDDDDDNKSADTAGPPTARPATKAPVDDDDDDDDESKSGADDADRPEKKKKGSRVRK